VQAWVELHRDDLFADWKLAANGEEPFRIAPLQQGVSMGELLDVVRVQAKPAYLLELEFEKGECRLFDMSPIMIKKPYGCLKEANAFFAAHVDYGTVVWPGNIDIDPETLYVRSVPVGGKYGTDHGLAHKKYLLLALVSLVLSAGK